MHLTHVEWNKHTSKPKTLDMLRMDLFWILKKSRVASRMTSIFNNRHIDIFGINNVAHALVASDQEHLFSRVSEKAMAGCHY